MADDTAGGAPSVPAWEISDPVFETEGVRQLTVASTALAGRADVSLWVPGSGAWERPPVLVVLLHGVYGSHWAWFFKAGAHRVAARLLAAGEIGPVVLACPSDGLWGDGSGYLDGAGGAYETWVARDAVAAVRAALGDALGGGPAAIAGLSMGGYGAIRVGARHPETFSAAAGHSSITRLAEFGAFVRRLPEAASEGQAVDLVDALLAARDSLPAIRFDCGTDDPLLGANRRLHDELEAAGIAHEYAEHPGGHDWAYWAAHLEDTLRFVDRTVGGSASS